MKLVRLTILYLAVVSLVACVTPPSTPDNSMVTVPPTPQAMPTKAQDNLGDETEEAQIKALVENFGKRLQNVSLLAPEAAQQIQQQYAEFVSPALLEMWMNDLSVAPGRMVSSPWPDRIEIISLESADTDTYEIAGYVVEVTSNEVVNGGEAGKVLVHIVMKRSDGGWSITEYSEKQ